MRNNRFKTAAVVGYGNIGSENADNFTLAQTIPGGRY